MATIVWQQDIAYVMPRPAMTGSPPACSPPPGVDRLIAKVRPGAWIRLSCGDGRTAPAPTTRPACRSAASSAPTGEARSWLACPSATRPRSPTTSATAGWARAPGRSRRSTAEVSVQRNRPGSSTRDALSCRCAYALFCCQGRVGHRGTPPTGQHRYSVPVRSWRSSIGSSSGATTG
jgi:hypothetical protein